MTDVLSPVAAEFSRMVDLAWAAGVLDVSAQWVAIPRSTKHGQSFTPRVRIRGPLATGTTLVRLADILGGNVNRHKTRMEWQVSGAKASLALYETIHPYLRERGRTAQAHAVVCRSILSFKPQGLDRTVPDYILGTRAAALRSAAQMGVVVSPARIKNTMPPETPADDSRGLHDDIPF